MKGYFALWASLSLMCWLMSGCELMFQAGPGLTTGRDEYLKSIKPYIAYWEKEGIKEDVRQKDSLSCRSGGVTAGGIYKPDFDKALLPDETESVAYNRLMIDWQRCMIRSGYHFTGDCSSDWAKTQPACGAP